MIIEYVIKILKDSQNRACGIVCLNKEKISESNDLTINVFMDAIETVQSDFTVLAIGGAADIYQDAVYPLSQYGSMGLAMEAGVIFQNLTESQFGLSSIKFRWNLSGAYQQVIPRYISLPADEDPLQPISDPIEFLQDYFPEIQQLATAIFLKGYQWPFDAERIENYGSSLIDLAVYEETIGKGRWVYLDFQHNPEGFSLDNFEGEGKDYLVNSGVEQILPIDRSTISESAFIKII